MTLLRGVVTSGVGDLAGRMRQHERHYTDAAGMALYPGSLNVRLPEPWPLPANTIQLPADLVGRDVHLVPCTVLGRRCYIFRTTNADKAGPDEQRIIEILAEVRLRDEHDLVDGDAIEIQVHDRAI